MSNMSYCRFQNTLRDFNDCKDALEEVVNDPASHPLSPEELAAAKSLAYAALNFLQLVMDESGMGNGIEDLLATPDAEAQLDLALTVINESCNI